MDEVPGTTPPAAEVVVDSCGFVSGGVVGIVVDSVNVEVMFPGFPLSVAVEFPGLAVLSGADDGDCIVVLLKTTVTVSEDGIPVRSGVGLEPSVEALLLEFEGADAGIIGEPAPKPALIPEIIPLIRAALSDGVSDSVIAETEGITWTLGVWVAASPLAT